MEFDQPKGLLEKVKEALGFSSEPSDVSETYAASVPPESEIAFERDLGGAPTQATMNILAESQADRLRREAGEAPRDKSALELNAESARFEDGE